MRKYAILKNPQDEIKRIMIYDTGTEVYLFLNTSIDDDIDMPGYDEWYQNIEDAMRVAAEYGVCEDDWINIDDPLPHCQDDTISPIRIKGRCDGKPQWGKFEKLINGVWVDWQKNDD